MLPSNVMAALIAR